MLLLASFIGRSVDQYLVVLSIGHLIYVRYTTVLIMILSLNTLLEHYFDKEDRYERRIESNQIKFFFVTIVNAVNILLSTLLLLLASFIGRSVNQ